MGGLLITKSAFALAAHPSLQSLHVPNTMLRWTAGESLAEVLKTNTTLTSLSVEGNPVSFRGGAAILSATAHKCALVLWSVTRAAALSPRRPPYSPTLRALYLTRTYGPGMEHCPAFCRAFASLAQNNRTLEVWLLVAPPASAQRPTHTLPAPLHSKCTCKAISSPARAWAPCSLRSPATKR